MGSHVGLAEIQPAKLLAVQIDDHMTVVESGVANRVIFEIFAKGRFGAVVGLADVLLDLGAGAPLAVDLGLADEPPTGRGVLVVGMEETVELAVVGDIADAVDLTRERKGHLFLAAPEHFRWHHRRRRLLGFELIDPLLQVSQLLFEAIHFRGEGWCARQ